MSRKPHRQTTRDRDPWSTVCRQTPARPVAREFGGIPWTTDLDLALSDDAAYATFRLEGGIVAHFNSSWAVRVRRDDLLTIQVDRTNGSAVAGLRHCWIQP